MQPRRDVPKELTTAKVQKQGEYKVMLYNHKMIGMRLLDRKHVILLSTAYGSRSVNTDRKHWQTKEPISKPETINKFMGGVDLNDQLLKYSAFSRHSLKLWKTVFFRLMNMAMVNSQIMHKAWLSAKPSTKTKRVIQTDFCANVIKAAISEAGNELIPPAAPRNSTSPIGYEVQQLSGQHFSTKIEMVSKKSVVLKKRVSRLCKVCVPCVPAKHSMDTQADGKPQHPGRETSCKCPRVLSRGVALCFSLYHQYKDYENK